MKKRTKGTKGAFGKAKFNWIGKAIPFEQSLSNDIRDTQPDSMKEAIGINSGIDKTIWMQAVKDGAWCIGHNNTRILLKYPNTDILFRYVESVPQDKFAEFVTVYGEYVKDFVLRHHAKLIAQQPLVSINIEPKELVPDLS